jgi:formylglycine-generating enzyme required for sulfatase activity
MSTFLSAFTRTRHALCALCALCAVACFAGPVHAAGEPRIALVVGNAGYEDSPLANPVNDASDMAKELKRLGFAVTLRTNQNADQLKELIADFGDQLARSKGVGLFYFAGHGVQVKGQNYLLPVGRRYRRERDVEMWAVESRAVLARMEEAGNPLNIVILDACRDSPLPPETRTAGSRGLARDTVPSGALIAYATAPGRTADDRRGARNGLYTGHLLQALREPGLRLEDVFGRVRDAVERDSARQQSPEEVVKLRGQPFYFMPPPAPRPEPVAPSGPRVGDVFRDCADCPEMVVLPAGSFEMGDLHGDGDKDEKPVRRVRIGQAFAMGKYEVTQGEWLAVMGSNPSHFKDCGDRCPVELVSWDEVQAFIGKLKEKTGKDYRLPSEAEWEYACRAGGRNKWCGSDAVGSVAWYDNNSGSKTHAVGGKKGNGWGLYDLSGNVYEWGQDCYEESGYDQGQPVDGGARESRNNCARRVIRGGGWVGYAGDTRSANRYWYSPDLRGFDLGFRLLRTLP